MKKLMAALFITAAFVSASSHKWLNHDAVSVANNINAVNVVDNADGTFHQHTIGYNEGHGLLLGVETREAPVGVCGRSTEPVCPGEILEPGSLALVGFVLVGLAIVQGRKSDGRNAMK